MNRTYLQTLHVIGTQKTKKSVGHPRQPNSKLFPLGKKPGRPPAEECSYTFVYSLHDKNVNVKVCLSVLYSIRIWMKRLLVLKQKMKSVTEVCTEPDRCGRHGNRPQKIPEEVWECVREHIQTFPITTLVRTIIVELTYPLSYQSLSCTNDILQTHDPISDIAGSKLKAENLSPAFGNHEKATSI